MRPFLPPSPTLSFSSHFRQIKSSTASSSASSSSALDPFNLRRRPSGLGHRASQSLAPALLPPLGIHSTPTSPTQSKRRTHRRTATGSMGSAGAKAALQAASSMLPAALRPGVASREGQLPLPFADKLSPASDQHRATQTSEYTDADLAIESLFAGLWNFGCLVYLTSDIAPGVSPDPSAWFDSLRLFILALVLVPLLLSLSSGARAISTLDTHPISPIKELGVWCSTVGSGVGLYVWSRYLTEDWSLSTPWLAYQALVLAIGIAGVVYNSVVRKTKGLDQHIEEAEPLIFDFPPAASNPSSQPGTPTRSTRNTPLTSPVQSPGTRTPGGTSRENLVAMLA